MNSKLRRLLSLLMAQALIIMSIPAGALALTPHTAESDFELPINEKIEASAPSSVTALKTEEPNDVASATEVLEADNQAVQAEQIDESYLGSESAEYAQPAEPALTGQATLTEAAVSEQTAAGDQPAATEEPVVVGLEEALGAEAEEMAQDPQVVETDAVIVVDNDKETGKYKAEVKWEEIKDAPGKTKIEAGARFPVAIVSSVSSKTAKKGDPIEARLKTDIRIGGRLVAQKGDRVVGHISSCMKARRILHAELSHKRWMRANGCLGLEFDEIITRDGEHLPLVAKPAFIRRVVKNKHEGRVLGVNHKGELASPLSTQLKHQAAHLAIRSAASAAGVFSMGIVPAAYGIVGAINPSFAFLQPVGKNVPHRRLKGFAMGVVSGLPGGFLIADTIIRGKEAVIKPGDTFLAEFKQEFTGEAASSASLIPGSSTKVQGEVMDDKK